MVLAPSSPSVEVLRAQDFTNANTVDEAGFLSVRQMLKLEEFAVENDCRLIVTGDTKQHHCIQWGDALRILERSGVVAHADLTKIYRRRIPELREATNCSSHPNFKRFLSAYETGRHRKSWVSACFQTLE